MHIVLTVVSVLIVLTGVAFRLSNNQIGSGLQKDETPDVLSSEDIAQVETKGANEKDDVIPTLLPTSTITPTKPHVTIIPQEESNLISYKYPNSQIVTSTANSLNTTSTDNPDTITSWYKEKIRSEGLNVKSFVTTKTNGNFLSKLVGASSEKEIRINIEKPTDEIKAHIEVSLK